MQPPDGTEKNNKHPTMRPRRSPCLNTSLNARDPLRVPMARTLVLTFSLSGALALAAGGSLHAQNNPADFSLPTPSPTPTPAPQGPLDERAGVPIAPRIITPERRLPETAPSPQPSPIVRRLPPEPAPTTTAAPGASPSVQGSTAPQRSPQDAGTPRAGSGQTPSPPTLGNRGVDDRAQQRVEPADQGGEAAGGFAPDFGVDGAAQDDARGTGDLIIGEGEWVDDAPSPSIDLGPPREANGTAIPAYAPPQPPNWGLWAALALALIALALIIRLAWRGRKAPVLQIESDLAKRTRRELSAAYDKPLGEQDWFDKGPTGDGDTERAARPPQPSPQPAPTPPAPAKPPLAPKPSPAAQASRPQPMPRLSLSLEIGSATRSVMMFTLQYRLTIANRTDTAVRDLAISARLASAQRGASKAAAIAGSQPIGTIDRIGPQQSRSITATMQLPMVEVRALRQGSTPVFIPLLHIVLKGIGHAPVTTSFVIGTPSEANQLRLHPITLDTPPGSVTGLRANELRQPISEPVTAKPG
ncbi:MAG: hypothetical protein WBA51_01575 [Erythrobacter sp.]